MKGKVFLFSGIVIALLSILPVYNLTNESALFKNKSFSGKFHNLYNMDVVESWFGTFFLKYGLSIEPKKVLIGKDGWLFLGDSFAKTLTKKIRGASVSDTDLINVRKANTAWNEFFRKNGVQDFKLIIGPDKDSVYTDKLPEWDMHAHDTVLDSLLHSNTELYVDTITPLLQEKVKTDKPLYYHTDTHWNSYGAAIAFNALASAMQLKHTDLKWPGPFTSKDFKMAEGRAGDLAAFLRVKNVKEELVYLDDAAINQTNIKIYDFKTGKLMSDKRLSVIGAPPTPVLVVSDNALNNDRVLWLRDSYGTAMSPFMSITFKEVLQVHQGKVTPELLQIMVKSFKPKFIFITSVEREALGRFFTTLPEAY
ncbi:hypothetical protein [Citrobacter sp. RHB25-C09]|uniref:alginate O-acetyltransferase AlgX-related protein n=1 Tax=Citrobacter sp. RHB25-C09 TaxID=2742624 RepID=UPI0015EE6605|nr:hypothetical protein [Citrobacter sp. RHB25-C09]QMI05464.1 hypothetical protein HVY19_11560 [Citrobacter sp. RHB25-C09]